MVDLNKYIISVLLYCQVITENCRSNNFIINKYNNPLSYADARVNFITIHHYIH